MAAAASLRVVVHWVALAAANRTIDTRGVGPGSRLAKQPKRAGKGRGVERERKGGEAGEESEKEKIEKNIKELISTEKTK